MDQTPIFFHPDQLAFKPVYEWSHGEKLDHPEKTARAESIFGALREASGRYAHRVPSAQPWEAIRAVHSYELITLYNAAQQLPDGEDIYPSVFPRELRDMGDPTNIRHAGCFCFDSGTPLNNQTLEAAAWSAACAYEGALALEREQRQLVYALSRPPGHHATEHYFGGYSYFNNTAIAANVLSAWGDVVILDIDFHHGNGSQSFFYERGDVLTISIHGDPSEYYPFYCGFAHERGEEEGQGYNMNFCLPGGTDLERYLELVELEVVPAIERFAPRWLVVAAGFDTYREDPIGEFVLESEDFERLGARIAALGFQTLVVQEGGYYTPALGENVVRFLDGMRSAS